MCRRDPTKPFFLYLSFHRPHPPYERVLGDWESDWDEFRRDGDYQAAIGDLPDRVVHWARAGYYGLMAQIDLQVNRIRESLAGLPVPSSVDGKSLAAYVRGDGEAPAVREWLHGEHVYWDQSLQWVTDGRVKYVWGSAKGVEQLFDLVADPGELHGSRRRRQTRVGDERDQVVQSDVLRGPVTEIWLAFLSTCNWTSTPSMRNRPAK